ncbi:MAG: FtsQ-type POTRA domain-containing protein [Candidatus Eremiobacteraeota bacterium]|nr:FtsQ-type POTRA domain-containing protein [Candidatus Eremiobacteraeota bacterium]
MVITLCALLILAGVVFAATFPGFDPKAVTVSGNRRVARNDILAKAAIAPHTSIWLQNTGAMARRIATIPYIAAVTVRRIPPATLRIRVAERVPFAEVRSGWEAAVVDRSLRVLEPASAETSLPVIVLDEPVELAPGEFIHARTAAELIAASDALTAAQITPAQLELDRFEGLVVTLPTGLRLMLGSESDLPRKLALVHAILSQTVTRGRRVAAIDLRAPSAPVLVYR